MELMTVEASWVELRSAVVTWVKLRTAVASSMEVRSPVVFWVEVSSAVAFWVDLRSSVASGQAWGCFALLVLRKDLCAASRSLEHWATFCSEVQKILALYLV